MSSAGRSAESLQYASGCNVTGCTWLRSSKKYVGKAQDHGQRRSKVVRNDGQQVITVTFCGDCAAVEPPSDECQDHTKDKVVKQGQVGSDVDMPRASPPHR